MVSRRPLLVAIAASLLAGLPSAQEKDLLGHWEFAPPHLHDGAIRNQAGGTPARLEGHPRILARDGGSFLLLTSREERAIVTRDLTDAALPREAFTAEAWVSIDAPQPWGAIVGAMQDNGGYERGWLLGYRGAKFCFGVASEGADDGDGLLTYLTGTSDFEIGRWYHVLGSYDGATMRLFVNGKEEATSTAQSGPLLYPDHGVFEIGGYHDDDEDFPLYGLIQYVKVWGRARGAAEVRAAHGNESSVAALPEDEAPAMRLWDFTGPGPADGSRAMDGPPPALAMPLAGYDGHAFTVSTVVQLDDLSARGALLGVRGRDGRADWVLGLADSRLHFGILRAGGVEEENWAGTRLDPHSFAWLHVLVAYDGWLQRIYVNGTLAGTRRGAFGAAGNGMGAELVIGTLADTVDLRAVPGRVREVRLWNEALPDRAARAASALSPLVPTAGFTPDFGPFVRFTATDRATFQFSSRERRRAVEIAAVGEPPRRFTSVDPDALIEVAGLAPDTLYRYRLLETRADGEVAASKVYTLDTAFNYEPPPRPSVPSPFPDDERGALCKGIAGDLPPVPGRGYCLLLGAPDGRLAFEIATRTELKVVVVEEDPTAVQRARRELAAAGLYGWRVAVHHGPLDELPFGDWFATVVLLDPTVAPDRLPSLAAEMSRVLRPHGGSILLRPSADDPVDESRVEELVALFDIPDRRDLRGTRAQSGLLLLRSGAPPMSDSWSHQYGTPANTAATADDLVADDLEVQWFGRPGPRPMLDRGGRSPAPLSAGGRLFVQGDRRLFALDAYNGTILWTLEIPELRRANLPRDSSNMVAIESPVRNGAHDGLLLLALGNTCLRIDAATGEVDRGLDPQLDVIPGGIDDWQWGYLAVADQMVLGTLTADAATYRGAEGEWYDGPGAEAEDVLGRSLFAIDVSRNPAFFSDLASTTRPRPAREGWSYGQGGIIQSTIAVDQGTVYFVEDRAPAPESVAKGRLVSMTGTDQYLVALDLATGAKRWERTFDFQKCDRVFYLSVSDGVIVVTGSADASYLYGFSGEDGREVWSHRQEFVRDHHGGAMQHPAITGGVVYHDRHAVDLYTGELLRADLPERRGCGTIAASKNGLFYRHYSHSFWDFATGTASEWTGVRSGCWLGMIPAGGLLLAPEASSGCSCADPIQTSVAFRPAGGK